MSSDRIEAHAKTIKELSDKGAKVVVIAHQGRPGLYDFITGPAARKGFRQHQTNQDWENNLLIYPTEVLILMP